MAGFWEKILGGGGAKAEKKDVPVIKGENWDGAVSAKGKTGEMKTEPMVDETGHFSLLPEEERRIRQKAKDAGTDPEEAVAAEQRRMRMATARLAVEKAAQIESKGISEPSKDDAEMEKALAAMAVDKAYEKSQE
ncbi:MAG: hypothetical protein WC797_01275 [Candidatus Paceibacterota bacterium]|jgi:hypothetical protein